ncbi:MAG: hydantoinase/oxoprolinase family protein [Gammaproteobacteria bacterium]|nr:MAG: hydantoinase/oxoprolinase family protein [Gammaproteobacteria bacterium]
MLLGVDTGGTFTDFVLYDGERLRIHKVLSTPAAPEQAILQGIDDLQLRDKGQIRQGLIVVHGSTVATNAVLEGKGVRTVYITNRGLRDVLSIGRQARRELYNLQPPPLQVPFPRELCLEVGGRLAADGSVVEALTESDLDSLVEAIASLKPRAVAINLLYSFLDARHEQALAARLQASFDGIFVSCSSRVLAEYKEYERGLATWLNAYVGPLMQGYLQRLQATIRPASVSVMQGSGQTIAADQAADQAVHLLLSGPAGGLAGAAYVGRACGLERLLSFDMGGTSTDVALVDGQMQQMQLTSEGHIGPYPVAVAMLDIHTIGAGGGSIARVDQGGLLQVGPESAGATPGPACYAQGGRQATVTDANLVLGRLRAEAFLGGEMSLQLAAAREAIAVLAGVLGGSIEQTALGIIQVANEHMVGALRVISVQRGIDPAEFTLASFGGAGGLHVCALAEALRMGCALVPIHAGVLSALGMLVAPQGRQLSRTVMGRLEQLDPSVLQREFQLLEDTGREELLHEGLADDDIQAASSVDLRYFGQSYTLNVPWLGIKASIQAFHEAHQARYGHRLDGAVELVNQRVAVSGVGHELTLQAMHATQSGDARPQPVRLYAIEQQVPMHTREQLPINKTLPGPLLITERVSTTFVAVGWACRRDPMGNLLLTREA